MHINRVRVEGSAKGHEAPESAQEIAGALTGWDARPTVSLAGSCLIPVDKGYEICRPHFRHPLQRTQQSVELESVMKAELQLEASAVRSAIQRITGFCREWDSNCRVLIDPAIDENSGTFHIAVKVGSATMLNSPSPVRATEILALTDDRLWETLFHWSGERIKRPAA
jgi:hypothetical protein